MAYNQTTSISGRIPKQSYFESPESKRKEFLNGFGFPMGYSSDGNYLKKTSGVFLVKNALTQLLLTNKGERLMLPNFGCDLQKYLFQPLDEITFEEIKEEIITACNNYLVGATLKKIAVFPLGESGPLGGNSLQIILTLQLSDELFKTFDVEVSIK